MGEITTRVPANTAAPSLSLRDNPSFNTTKRAMAQKTHKYNGFTRSQHAIPSTLPAASASQTLLRCSANNNSQQPPSTNHVAGTSAEGYAAYSANSAENPTRKPLAIAARQPNAVTAMPQINSGERIRSRNHNTI